MKRPASVLVVLLSLPLALATQQGLSCVNDLVSNVNCTWKNRDRDGGQDCWVSAETKVRSTEGAHTASCKLSSPPGPHCSMSFQPYDFHPLEVLPKINVTCGGALVDTVSHYTIKKNIQMNPPGEPSISRMGNGTWVIWNPGYPLSQFITEFEFQVELRQSHESEEVRHDLRASNPKLWLEPSQLKGRCQVKVRVKAASYPLSIWSEWSPTTPWECSEPEASDAGRGLPKQPPDQTQTIVWALMSSLLGVVFLAVLVLCRHLRSLKMKPVPNPSKYFQTLHSVHSGNLKKWLNPHSTAASVFMAQHQENISPVEVCGLWPAARPTSPSISSTTGLLSGSDVTTGSDTSGVVDSSSSSFSNMGYFLSSYGCRKTAANPLSFMNDFHHLQSHGRFPSHISLPFLNHSPHGCPRREVPAPDSGFSLGKESDGSTRELLTGGSGSTHATLQGLLHSSSGEAQMEQPAEISSAAWPGGGTTCRASSMPVESSNPGYFTLKDIQQQLTFRNNSL
ncbi:interleukin-2 receptor subunit beta isoform X2 [Synchiropus splendidus]|uniref:interleukin-2 receptor subunit beta isoform X2 n=1 Tax=Synchiropus splendidus TaxID=270530 RepID=UPI00237E7A8D|nr:interleukin-2 receptor subunit beta isoform X2 [Synchiropus splendidus]